MRTIKRFLEWFSTKFAPAIPLLLGVGCAQNYPGVVLSNKTEISHASSNATQIWIAKLPVQDYPLLLKFTKVEQIELDSVEATLATNEKLKALSQLGFTNDFGITLYNCPLITDDGISALSGIHSLIGLALEGTAITDEACAVMASRMRLAQLNVANCNGVTLKGLKALTTSDTLRSFMFSADKLTQDEVLSLIGSYKNVTECEIVDPQGKLNLAAINAKCTERKIKVMVKATGVLQDLYGITNSSVIHK